MTPTRVPFPRGKKQQASPEPHTALLWLPGTPGACTAQQPLAPRTCLLSRFHHQPLSTRAPAPRPFAPDPAPPRRSACAGCTGAFSPIPAALSIVLSPAAGEVPGFAPPMTLSPRAPCAPHYGCSHPQPARLLLLQASSKHPQSTLTAAADNCICFADELENVETMGFARSLHPLLARLELDAELPGGRMEGPGARGSPCPPALRPAEHC